jgi:hypothetical protein
MKSQKAEPPDSRRLDRDELNFLRGDADSRVKKDDGTAEIEAVANSPRCEPFERKPTPSKSIA